MRRAPAAADNGAQTHKRSKSMADVPRKHWQMRPPQSQQEAAATTGATGQRTQRRALTKRKGGSAHRRRPSIEELERENAAARKAEAEALAKVHESDAKEDGGRAASAGAVRQRHQATVASLQRLEAARQAGAAPLQQERRSSSSMLRERANSKHWQMSSKTSIEAYKREQQHEKRNYGRRPKRDSSARA